MVEDIQVGWIEEAHRAVLSKECRGIFIISDGRIHLSPNLKDFDARTEALKKVVKTLRKKSLVSDWKSEMYGVAEKYGTPALFAIERSVTPFFGVETYGTHLNGYVKDAHGNVSVWVAKRSKKCLFAPGQYDNLAAGGLPYGIPPNDNIKKEAEEECQMPANLAGKAKSKGTVSYLLETPKGATPDVMFVYDLRLPNSYRPVPDGEEVEKFELINTATLKKWVEAKKFKYNSALVMIDFMMRHKAITKENEPDLDKIRLGLKVQSRFFERGR